MVETESKAQWAIEIEKISAGGERSEFYSVIALRADLKGLQILTEEGKRIAFKPNDIRKVLMMRVKEQEQEQA